MRKGIYLFGFSLLCVTVMLGSHALMQQDTQHYVSSSAASGIPQYRADARAVYVSMSQENARMGMAVTAQHTPMAQGHVMSVATPAKVYSYGGGVSSASTGATTVTAAQPATAMTAVPQVSHRSMVRNATQRPVASARHSAPRKAIKAQPTGRALSTTTAAGDLSLGYSSAAQYINHSPMRKPPVVTDGGSWNEWLQGIYGDTQYVDMNTLYDTWLSQQGNTNMPDGGTWEDFLAWFDSDNNTYYRVPVGDGAIWLILLASLYMLIIYMKNKTHKPIEIQ